MERTMNSVSRVDDDQRSRWPLNSGRIAGPAVVRRLPVALLAAAVLGAGCGDDGGGDAARSTTSVAETTTTSSATSTTTTSTATTVVESVEVVYDFSGIGAIVDGFVEEQGLSGAGLVVVQADDGVVFEHYAGEFTSDRISLVGSATKPVSAVVLARLHDDGLLDLDAPIAEYVDWADEHPTVTTAQLLSSSSGLPTGVPTGPPDYACQFLPSGTLQECAEQILTSDQEDADVVSPDSEFRYGGVQWQIAGAVAEAVSGRSWEQLVEEFLVEPCGLEVFGYANHFEQFGGLEFNHPAGFDGDPASLERTNNPNIEAGAYTHPTDYAPLLQLHLNGGKCRDTQVLSPGSVDRLHRDRIGDVYGGDASHPTRGYAMGWWVDRETGIIDSNSAYGSVPWLDLDDDYGVFAAVEADWSAPRALKALLEEPIDDAITAANAQLIDE